MAKKKASSSSRKRLLALWPGDFTLTHALVALSVMFNLAFFTLLMAVASSAIFDDVIAKRGAEIICSEDYQNDTADEDAKVLLKYGCADDGAKTYFLNGYNEYRKSLNLKPVEE